MYKSTWDGTLAVMTAMGRSLLLSGTLGEARARVDHYLSKQSWMDRASLADVRATCEQVMASGRGLYKRGGWKKGTVEWSRLVRYLVNRSEDVMKAFNRAYKREWVRNRKKEVLDGMDLMRGKGRPVVFYLVSWHQKPQKAHAAYQGTVLVDRFWRRTLANHPEDLARVAEYLKGHKLVTVQGAMGAPNYLITRPNCRHYLVPLETDLFLSTDLKDIKKAKESRPVIVKRPLTDDQRHHVFLQMKATLKGRLDK